ncbi:MAG: hypothetical protein ACE37N_15395 [Pseudohongiellaceae bacterium]|jgi:hypothetical protein
MAYMGWWELRESDPDMERIVALIVRPGTSASADLMESYALTGF